MELLNTLAEKEKITRHLETSTVFSGFSTIIQNDLIATIGDVIRNDIKKEISAALFAALAQWFPLFCPRNHQICQVNDFFTQIAVIKVSYCKQNYAQ